MAILVLFKQFSTLMLRASPHTMHFVRSFSIMRANKGVRLIAIEVVRYYEKVAYIKNILKMPRGWMHTPHFTLLDPLMAISYSNHRKSLAYISLLAPLVLLFFYFKAESKGERRHNAPLSKYVPA